MAVTMRNGAVSRRRVLASLTAAGATTFAGGIAKPYLSRAADRPVITHGVQSGDVSIDSGVVWARADRPARMVVEASTTESFKAIIGRAAADALAGDGFHRKGATRRTAPRTGHSVPRDVRGSRASA